MSERRSGRSRSTFNALAAVALGAGIVSGCATTPISEEAHDPIEPANRTFFAVNNALDRMILAPLAEGYVAITPEPMRDAIFNFLDNLAYPGVFVNDFLQGKVEQGFEDMGRFVFNSTFGLGGLIDFSTGIGLERHDEDFGQTLAVWGLGEGAYLELPFFGPNTTRDVADIPASTFTDVLFFVESGIAFPLGILRLVDQRARLSSAIKVRDEALDPYIFQREGYRQRRNNLIHDGNPPLPDIDEPPPDGEGGGRLIIQ